MRPRRSSVLRIAAACLFCGAAIGSALAAQQNRIVQFIDSSQVAAVPGTTHPLARPELDQGPVNASLKLEGLTLNFKRSTQQQADLDQLLAEQQTPGSPNYHRWLTQAEFGDRFGMSQSDIRAVTAWLTSLGFEVREVAVSRTSIRFAGSVDAVEQAFHTQMRHYLVNGEMHFANATEVQLPRAFAASVVSVGGLNDFRPKARLRRPSATLGQSEERTVHPDFTSAITGNTYVAPGDFAVIYHVSPLYTAGYTGSGQQIVVAGQTNIHSGDISAFRSAAGLPAANLSTVCISVSQYCSGTASYSVNDESEADLDIEWSGAVAQNATINFIYAGGADPHLGVFDALQYAVDTYTVSGKVVPIISVSYGDCESTWGASALLALQGVAKQANAQGQTIVGPAGDSGAADCEAINASTATQGLAVDAPASLPEVTGVGGSEFLADQSNPSQYWTNGGVITAADVLTSALGYIPEEAWNDTTASVQAGTGLAAGGGGLSNQFAQPIWQAGLTPPGFSGTPMRFVPDLSLNASLDHDGYLYCTQVYSTSNVAQGTSCTNGFRYSDTTLSVVGGTSAGVPSFAGILSLIEQKAGATGFGNINPALYLVAQDTVVAAFHDITAGNNQVPCLAGTPDCPNGGDIGYHAGVGYDLATGWGSVDANALASALIISQTAVATTAQLTVNPSSNLVVNQTVTLTVTVQAQSGSTMPTGSVTFTVDGTALGFGAITLSPQGTAQTTTTFTTAGSHTIVASYSSHNLSFMGSSASANVTVQNSSMGAPTTTTVTPSASSVVQGTAFSLSATVTSTTAGPITGNVVFSAGGSALGTVTLVGTPATATLNVTATQSAALANGTVTITATYQGDSNFATSNGTAQITITAAPSVSLTASSMTIGSTANGSAGSSAITVTSMNGFSGTVDFTNATIVVSPQTINANFSLTTNTLTLTSGGTATNTLIVTLTSTPGQVRRGTGKVTQTGSPKRAGSTTGRYSGGAMALLVVGLFFVPRRRALSVLAVLLVFAVLGAGIACGGASNSGTLAGSYTVTVGDVVVTNTATGAQTTLSTTAALTVQ